MSKLVNIETIRKDIESRKKAYRGYPARKKDFPVWMGICAELDSILAFFDTLSEEKPESLSSQKMIQMWDEELAMLKEKDFRDDAERMAYTAYIDGLTKGYYLRTSEELG